MVIFQIKARISILVKYLNLHGAHTRAKYRLKVEQKRLFMERLFYIIIGATSRYTTAGNSRDPKYSATAKIASSHGNCNRVLIA